MKLAASAALTSLVRVAIIVGYAGGFIHGLIKGTIDRCRS